MRQFEEDKVVQLNQPMTPTKAISIANGYDLRPYMPTTWPFQTMPTTSNKEAHHIYLNLRLMDHMNELIPLTPSYSWALRCYQKSVEPRLVEANAIKQHDVDRRLHTIEKTRIKSGSSRYVQKNGVLYIGKGRSQILERNQEEEVYRASIVNMALERKIKKTNKEYSKWVKALKKEYDNWNKNAKKVNYREFNVVVIDS